MLIKQEVGIKLGVKVIKKCGTSIDTVLPQSWLTTHETGVRTVMHRVTQTSTTVSCSKIVVRMTWLRLLTWGALLTRAAIDPPFASWAPRGPVKRKRSMVRPTTFFFLCQHVLITHINCNRYSQPYEPIQNMQITFKAFIKVPNCTFPAVAPICLVSLSSILRRF
jgi:hypothetical protein